MQHTGTTQEGSRSHVQVHIMCIGHIFPVPTVACMVLPPLFYSQHIGHLYVYSTSGTYIAEGPRRVYFEASDPQQPIMRVPKSRDDEETVVTSYPWDSSEFAHMHNKHRTIRVG